MDEIMQEVIAGFETERAGLLALLDSITPDDWSRIAVGNEDWTVKDTVAHLAASDRSMGSLVKGVAEGTYSIEQAKGFMLDDYNARQIDRRREFSPEDLRNELDENRKAFLDLVRGLGDDAWQAEVWVPGFSGAAGRIESLHDRMLEYADHDSVHGEQIRAAVSR